MTQAPEIAKLSKAFERHYRPYKVIPIIKDSITGFVFFALIYALFAIFNSVLTKNDFVSSIFISIGFLPIFVSAIAGIIDRWLTFYSLRKIKNVMGYNSVYETIKKLEKEGFI